MNDLYYKIKWGFQRMFRGYDDSVFWELNDYISNIALPVLKWYKKNKMGYPHGFNSNKEWKAEISKMIKGFEAHDKISNWECKPKDLDKLLKIQKEGLTSFGKHFGALWD